MPANHADAVFRAVLSPHRSLSRRGFTIIMALLGGVSFAAGLVFLLIGAWPVVPFLGLDVALVYWAFRRNFADAGEREVVEVTESEVVLYRLRIGRPTEELRFPRGFVQVELEEDEEREIVGPLALRSRGRRFEFGGFLNPDDRRSFAKALKTALARPNI
ncbi:MAG: DUF2244 domain-containing protein [Parvibaculaceae bacterium]